ncbi:MAG: pyridoxal phosphate-dependent aminotransferase [Oscillospiraceae bacterium]|nr:pyridoxal phosphate-dependent aminotransferase [Oscillospiraceae bacterium]
MLVQKNVQLGQKRSCIRELFEHGLRQAAVVGKENVFDFSIGNPSVPAPAEVAQAFHDLTDPSLDSLSIHGYTTAMGDADAREAIAADLRQRYDFPVQASNIFMTCGAAPALTAVFHALAVEGAEVVVNAPYFAEYRPFVEGAGMKFVTVPADYETFQINFPALEQALNPHTQAVIVNSPNNPSGVIYSREVLTRLAALLEEKSREYGHPIYIVSDEPYRELVYDGAEVPFLPAIYPDTVICYSYSKSFSLPGERIGYVLVNDRATDSAELYAAVAGSARALGHVCAPSLMQKVVGRCAHVRPNIEVYDLNRKTLYQALQDYGYQCVKPQGAFYLMIKAPGGSGKAFSDRAKAENLLLVPCDDFGVPEYVRASTCVSHEMVLKSLPVFKKLIEEA